MMNGTYPSGLGGGHSSINFWGTELLFNSYVGMNPSVYREDPYATMTNLHLVTFFYVVAVTVTVLSVVFLVELFRDDYKNQKILVDKKFEDLQTLLEWNKFK